MAHTATTFTVRKLMELVEDGTLRIPAFQRPLKWRSQDNCDLVDSILEGLPVGTLLLWRRPAQDEVVTYGPVQVESAARPDALHVVDGQQRLTALAGTLLHPDPRPTGGLHALWYDLDEQGVRLRRRSDVPATWVPIRALRTPSTVMRWMRDWPLRDVNQRLVQVEDLADRLQSYEIPAYIVETEDEAVVRKIFLRTNKSGRKLEDTEVFAALNHSTYGIPEVQSAVDSATRFGTVSEKSVLRAHKLISEQPMKEEPAGVEDKRLQRTTVALIRAVTWLQQQGIPHRSLLPSELPLYVLAYFFHRHEGLPATAHRSLSRWLWRGWINGEHTQSANSTLERLRQLCQQPVVEAAQGLELGNELSSDDFRRIEPWQGGSIATKLYALYLLHAANCSDTEKVSAELEHRSVKALFPLIDGQHLERRFLLGDVVPPDRQRRGFERFQAARADLNARVPTIEQLLAASP